MPAGYRGRAGAALGGLAAGAAITAALPVEGAAAVAAVGVGSVIIATSVLDHAESDW